MRRGSILPTILAVASCSEHPPSEKTALSNVGKPEHPAVIETRDFTLPFPEGYSDKTAELQKSTPHVAIALVASTRRMGHEPTIVVQKAPIPGGTFADPAICAQTGNGILKGGTMTPGTGGTLKSAEIVDGPVGKTCQIHIVTREGVALITELYQPGNTPSTPQDVWLLTCNYADGDALSEARCRSTLAGFRFTK
jgi:hypothetical protein